MIHEIYNYKYGLKIIPTFPYKFKTIKFKIDESKYRQKSIQKQFDYWFERPIQELPNCH